MSRVWKFRVREFSEGTLKNLLQRYPGLDEFRANLILTNSKVYRDDEDSKFPGTDLYMREPVYMLRIDVDHRPWFFGEEEVYLVPGEDGVIYTERYE